MKISSGCGDDDRKARYVAAISWKAQATALCEVIFQGNKAHAGKARALKWSMGRVHQARARGCTFDSFGSALNKCGRLWTQQTSGFRAPRLSTAVRPATRSKSSSSLLL